MPRSGSREPGRGAVVVPFSTAVILSAAKDLWPGRAQILRRAQDDTAQGDTARDDTAQGDTARDDTARAEVELPPWLIVIIIL